MNIPEIARRISGAQNSPEFCAEVLTLKAEGVSQRAIAQRVGATKGRISGIWRRAIVAERGGRCRRKVAQPGKAKRVSTTDYMASARRGAMAKQMQGSPAVLGGGAALERVGLRDCRYPIGSTTDPDFRFCRKQRKPGSPYCQEHHAVCHIPLPRPGEQSVKTGPQPYAEAAE